MNSTADISPGRSATPAVPFRLWWGLLGSAAIMGLMLLLGPYSDPSMFVEDKGDFWYYWQLAEPTAWTRLSAWVPYVLHQVAIWYLIAQGRSERPKYIFGLHWFNVWAIGINVFFILLHIAQTKFFYDGLAQDVHEATSMMSVILMLFLILLMENRRRGLVLGKPVKALNEVGDVVRRYHGYYFSWAIIYTFWYHPVELTAGHLLGFSYMMLLILQSSLFFTRYHTNRWWTMSLETLFIFHGAVVAYSILQKGGDAWIMFLFGGVATFLLTQLHGLGLSARQKWAIAIPIMLGVAVYYWLEPNDLLNLGRLPLIMYIGTFLMAGLIWPVMWLSRRARAGGEGNPEPSSPGSVSG